MLYRLWLHCCRRHEAVSLQQMVDFAPYQEDYLRRQDRYVDRDGRTTLNMAEYMAWRKTNAEKVILAKKQKLAKK